MTETADILTLAQWFSPAYPVGAFSYSHGLEQAIEAGYVTDADSLNGWISDVVMHGAGQSDGLFVAAAYLASDAVKRGEIDAMCRALTASRERLLETEAQGDAFCRATAAVWDVPLKALTFPVAVGTAARLQDLPLVLTSSMYLHAFASNLVTAGMRLVPLGQTEGHVLIRALAPLCQRIAEDTAHGDLDALTNTAFAADIAAMHHETQYSRIFRT